MTPVLMTLSLFVATAVAQLAYGSTLYFACTALDAKHVTFRHAFTNAMGVLILSLFVVLTTVAVIDHASWIFLFLPAWMAITVISYVSNLFSVSFSRSLAILLLAGMFFGVTALVLGRVGELVLARMAAA
jgi:hypothetical protein